MPLLKKPQSNYEYILVVWSEINGRVEKWDNTKVSILRRAWRCNFLTSDKIPTDFPERSMLGSWVLIMGFN